MMPPATFEYRVFRWLEQMGAVQRLTPAEAARLRFYCHFRAVAPSSPAQVPDLSRADGLVCAGEGSQRAATWRRMTARCGPWARRSA